MINETDFFTHACQVLEFRQLLELLASRAGTGCGRNRILSRRPSRNPAEVAAEQPLLASLMAFQTAGYTLPAPVFPDLDGVLQHAAPEGVILAGDELLPSACNRSRSSWRGCSTLSTRTASFWMVPARS